MRVVFRADSSAQIGTGHVMRCLALAHALRLKGAECTFICRDFSGNISGLIKSQGYNVSLLATPPDQLGRESVAQQNNAHSHWLGCSWSNDASQTISCLDAVPDWLIVDHYGIDQDWECALRPYCKKILVIDDLADRSHNCDLLLDQGLMSDDGRYLDLIATSTLTLFGPKYALLREEFRGSRGAEPEVRFSSFPRLLVMFGGADLKCQTERVVRELEEMNWQGPVDVVVGPLYPNIQSLQNLAKKLMNVQVHVSANDIAGLMARAGLAIGASGVTSLERCACGLPALTVAQASNQEALAKGLAEIGAHWYLGPEDDLKGADWSDALKIIARYPEILRAMSRAAACVCDGKGAARVASYLMGKQMFVRRATLRDVGLLYAWRNDERVRRMSQNPKSLDYPSHRRWMRQMLNNKDVDLLICTDRGQDVACVRFDCDEDVGTISIYVDPDRQGGGFGTAALHSSIDWICRNRPNINKIDANVMVRNSMSRSMFLSSGFHKIKETYSMEIS